MLTRLGLLLIGVGAVTTLIFWLKRRLDLVSVFILKKIDLFFAEKVAVSEYCWWESGIITNYPVDC